MRYGKRTVYLLTLLFAVLALVLWALEPGTEPAAQPDVELNMPLSVTAELDGLQENIRCWMDAEGNYVVFLPSGVAMADVTITPVEQVRTVLAQEPLETAVDCGGFQTDTSYGLRCTAAGITTEHTLTFLQSDRLPSMHLDVQSGSMDWIHQVKGNQEAGNLRLYSQAGELTWSGRIESIRGRGNTSWEQDKKSYSMTLAVEADLLGMGQAAEWVLLANALDPSHLRNKAVYDLAAETGMAYTPDCQWVDLYLNGDYAGLYLLSERNEIHPQRVDLQETGSFLMCRETQWRLISQNHPHITLDSGASLRIQDSGLTKADLRRIWQPAENAILAEDGMDPLTGSTWQELIDLDSWVMDYLTGEIFGNVDAGTISAYFYRDGSDPAGKICAGPVWDYDLSMGSRDTWQTQTVQAFFGDKAHIWSQEDTTWFYWLNRKPEFQNRVKELYQTVYRPLVQELLDTGLDAYAAQIQRSASLDQRRWGTAGAGEETAYIRRYLTERLAFLDSLWMENTQYYKVLVNRNDLSSALCHAVLPGETVPALPEYEEAWDVLGWYDAATEQPFDPTQPIYQDTVVYLKKLPAEEDQISPLQAAPIGAAAGILGILILADRARRRRKKGEKPIAKQEIL